MTKNDRLIPTHINVNRSKESKQNNDTSSELGNIEQDIERKRKFDGVKHITNTDVVEPHFKKMKKHKEILMIYTGGTIGMTKNQANELVPTPNFISNTLSSMYQFQKPFSPKHTLPDSSSGISCHFDIIEFTDPKDSVDMMPEDWNKIAFVIEEYFDEYDGFLILHGTDTLAYTASALSFILHNLSKPVVLTGSQIPLSEVRSDAISNMLGAFTVLRDLNIPEVTVFFNSELYRGNRVTKMDASGFAAFKSLNYPALVTYGVRLHYYAEYVRRRPYKTFAVRPITCSDVACVLLFPGINQVILKHILKPLKGAVLLSFGAGNCPSRNNLIGILKEEIERGLVIINVTQCKRGFVEQHIYETGNALTKIGVIGGEDITPEAALTKLMYLLSLDISPEEVKRRLTQNICGECTIHDVNTALSLSHRSFIQSVVHNLALFNSSESDVETKVAEMISPLMVCHLAAANDMNELRYLALHSNIDMNCPTAEGNTPFHVAASSGHMDVISFLLDHGADINALNKFNLTALDIAKDNGHSNLVNFLEEHGGIPAAALPKSPVHEPRSIECIP